MVFCHGKKAANSYVVFVAMIFVLSEFLRGDLLTSCNVTVFFFLSRRGKLLFSQIIYG